MAAFWFVVDARKTAKKTATIDMIVQMRLDKEYIELRTRFKQLKEGKLSLAEYAKDEFSESSERRTILDAINFHEFIACGIAEGAIDENLYKRMLRNVVVHDWKGVESFVTDLRNTMEQKGFANSERFFCEFQGLATKWESNP